MGNTPPDGVSKITADSFKPSHKRSIVLATALYRLPNSFLALGVITRNGIQAFNAETGAVLKERYVPELQLQILAGVFSPHSLFGHIAVICETSRVLRVIDTFNLVALNKVVLTELCSHMILPSPEIVYLGLSSGTVEVVHLSGQEVPYSWQVSGSIQALTYSSKNKVLVTSSDTRVCVHRLAEERGEFQVLHTEPCSHLVVADKWNLVLGLSKTRLCVWDINTLYQVLNFELPAFGSPPAEGTSLCLVSLPRMSDLLLIGFGNGTTLVSYLVFTEAPLNVTWTPTKLIRALDSSQPVTTLTYIEETDTLLIGDGGATVTLVRLFTQNSIELLPDQPDQPIEAEILDE